MFTFGNLFAFVFFGCLALHAAYMLVDRVREARTDDYADAVVLYVRPLFWTAMLALWLFSAWLFL